jgi:hypothetical protein
MFFLMAYLHIVLVIIGLLIAVAQCVMIQLHQKVHPQFLLMVNQQLELVMELNVDQ